MGFQWRLDDLLDAQGLTAAGLAERLGPPWGDRLARPPAPELTLADLSRLCDALNCEIGDLVLRVPDDPAEQAARALAADRLYQSFLSHRARLEGGETL